MSLGAERARIVFERAFGPIVDDNASALDLVVARADERTKT